MLFVRAAVSDHGEIASNTAPATFPHAAATALPSATTSTAGFTFGQSVSPLFKEFPYFDFRAVFSTFVTPAY